MLKHCSDSWSLFSFSPRRDRQLTERSAANGPIRTLLRRQPRSPRKRSKHFEVTEKARKVASLEMMVIDLEYMAMVLARQISTVVEVRRGRQRRRQARIDSVDVNTRAPISHPSRSYPVQWMNGLTRSALRQICSSAVVAGIDEALTSSASPECLSAARAAIDARCV